MKILITGGLGFLGGRLANDIRHRHAAEEIFLSTTRQHFPAWCRSFNVVSLDLRDRESIFTCIQTVKPDTVVHMGGLQQPDCNRDPKGAADVNERGMRYLVEACRKENVRRLLYLSSFQVYGNFVGSIDETTPPQPKHLYAASKLKGEEILRSGVGEDLQWVILRLSNVVGRPQDEEVSSNVWGLVFNAFCRHAIEEGKITIRSNQFRDFMTMEDFLTVMDAFLFSLTRWPGDIINVGGECCLSVKEVAEKVSFVYERLYRKGPLQIHGPTEDVDKDFQPFRYNIEKLKQMTGLTLQRDMDREIEETLKFCESLKKGSPR